MKRKNTTRNMLFTSVVSLLLCVSMLVGTTFAWFTDKVESGMNTITAGNLDVELYYSKTTDFTAKDSVEGKTQLFTDKNGYPITYWEPGVVAYTNLQVANEGKLALKYQLSVNFENKGPVDLSKALQVAVVKGGFEGDRAAAQALTEDMVPLESFTLSGKLEGEQKSETYGIVIYWEPTANDNQFNMNNENKGQTLSIDLGINLFATQEIYESDSFGDDYDALAPWQGGSNIDWYLANPDADEFTIKGAEELAGLAAIVNGTAVAPVTTFAAESVTTVHDSFKGKTIKLATDVNLNHLAWTPIGRIGTTSTDFTYSFKGTFDGQDHTISGLRVSNTGWAGVFGLAYQAQIKNLKVNDALINSNRHTGTIVGQLYGSIDNCHVVDADIFVIPNAVADGYDNGDKVGGIVGWLGDNGNNRMLTNCSATDVTLKAYRDVGGIAGYVAYSTTISGNAAYDVKITVDQITNYYGDKDFNAGLIWGRNSVSDAGAGVIDSNNTTDTISSISITYKKDGMLLYKDGITNEVVLQEVLAEYTSDTLAVPEGVDTIGNYAFQNNTSVKTVTLPSTVTDLGRGFDSSKVEKVVLNEGLTTISSRAFRSTDNLKEVVIPSTVTTIADNAFQKSGIKTITIPANVETIGETAFGASKIETVIIEGDTSVQGYAFRGCPNLRTVIMKGDVTCIPSTLNGRNSMWFCNGESNNPNTSNITFYVKDATVAERIRVAMGAEAGNTKIIINGTVSNADELAAAVAGGATEVYLMPGEYNVYNCGGKTLTINGSKDAVLKVYNEGENGVDYGFGSPSGVGYVTFNGVTIDTTADTGSYKGYAYMQGTYNNCAFVGEYCTVNQFDHTFNNCEFDFKNGYIWTWGAKSVTFNSCKFVGTSKTILAHGAASTVININDCTFAATQKGYAGGGLYWTAAVEIDPTNNNTYTINISGSTINENYNGWSRVKDSSTGHKITLDGAAQVSDGLYMDDSDNYYVYNANGLMTMRDMFGTWAADTLAGKSVNIMDDIDATGKTWTTAIIASGSSNRNGFTFNGNGHTISNLAIVSNPANKTPGTALFAMNSGNDTPTTFKDMTFDSVTVNGDTHTAILWGQMYGKIVVDNVNVINSSVTGTCNVGALVARNGDDGASEITFRNCSVKNTKVEATGSTRTDDKAGASAFLGMALKVGVNGVGVDLKFEGTNISENNTLTTAEGYQGGGIYTTSAWDTASWSAPVVVNDFTNHNSK